MKILAVDDEFAVLGLMLSVLHRGRGYEVHCATNAKDALLFLSLQAFDLVITDLTMDGGREGFKYLADLMLTHPDLPVVVQTAWVDEKTESLKKDKKTRVLEKPWKSAELLTVLDELTKKPA